MDLRQLRYFLAVADAGQMTRAAAALGIQQPPLSQQMQALERRVGVPLLVRHPKGVALTQPGEAFAAEARRLLAEFDAMTGRLERVAAGERGTLRVGFTSSAAVHAFTPRALRACRARHPEIELQLSENNAAEITEAVAEGRLHCGFLRVPVARPTGVMLATLLREPVVAALPMDHRLALRRARRVTVADLHGEPLILVRRPGAPGLYGNLLDVCDQQGVQPVVVAEVDRMTTNLSLVAAGVGMSVVPASMQGVHADAVAYRPFAGGAALDAPLTLAWRREPALPAAATFVALVHEIAGTGAAARVRLRNAR